MRVLESANEMVLDIQQDGDDDDDDDDDDNNNAEPAAGMDEESRKDI